MDTFFRFLYEFLMQFFSGVQMVFSGFINGIAQAFNYKNYVEVVNFYKRNLKEILRDPIIYIFCIGHFFIVKI